MKTTFDDIDIGELFDFDVQAPAGRVRFVKVDAKHGYSKTYGTTDVFQSDAPVYTVGLGAAYTLC